MEMQKKRSGFCNRDPIFKITGRQRILENTLSTLYLLIDILLHVGDAKEVIGFGDLDPIFKITGGQRMLKTSS